MIGVTLTVCVSTFVTVFITEPVCDAEFTDDTVDCNEADVEYDENPEADKDSITVDVSLGFRDDVAAGDDE